MITFCRTCGGPIRIMIQQNTGFSCQRCTDAYLALHKIEGVNGHRTVD